jgi:hypothetical protein
MHCVSDAAAEMTVNDFPNKTPAVIDGTYRYILRNVRAPGGGCFDMPKAIVISALHKFMRHGKLEEMAYLVLCFFTALAKKSEIGSSLEGSVTNFVNRFTITLFEEGGIAYMCTEDQTKVVRYLLRGRAQVESDPPDFCGAAQKFIKILRMVKGLKICRVGSLVKATQYAIEDMKKASPLVTLRADVLEKLRLRPTETEADVLASVTYETTEAVFDAKKSSAAYTWAYKVAKKYTPALAELINPHSSNPMCKRFEDSKELRKNIFSVAHGSRLLTVSPSPIEVVKDFVPKPFGEELLTETGVKDMHYYGIENEAARSVFQNTGCVITNKSSFSICGLTHEELEYVYVQVAKVTHAQKALAKKAAKAAKRAKKQTGGSIKKHITKPAVRRRMTPARADTAPPDGTPTFASITDLVVPDVSDGDRMLGFKNFTMNASLTAGAKERLALDHDKVFVKVGEAADETAFNCRAMKAMERLGMPFVPSIMVGVGVDVEWWRGFGKQCHAADPEGHEIHGKSYLVWTEAACDKYAGAKLKDGEIACALLQPMFPGKRLTYVDDDDPRLDAEIFGRTMLETLLFSKWCGSTDLGPFNLMVSEDGHVMQVDLGLSTDTQVSAYNGKGLTTSHRFKACYLRAAKAYARRNPARVGDFIRRLAVCGMPMRKGVQMPRSLNELF